MLAPAAQAAGAFVAFQRDVADAQIHHFLTILCYDHMATMIIGNFRHDWRRGIYLGEIKTLSLHREHVQFRSINKSREDEPDFRIIEEGQLGEVDLGEAWKRQDKDDKELLFVRLKDPVIGIEIDARLIMVGEDRAELWCSRRDQKAHDE